MTKVPQGFDFSFLNDEEARQILQVLERNEELQRAEKDRISKLQKTKRDIRWLQGVTGEWFEEIQRKKFRNDTDVNQMLKQPLTYRLRKAKNDAMHLPTSRSSNLPNRNNPSSARRPGFRSSLASLFSFRKSGKEILKPQTPSQGYDGFPRTSVTVKGTTGAGIYNSPLNTESSNTAFTPKPIGMREGSSMPPWDASQLENEFFQVLDDLDNKLAQEQALSPGNTRTPIHYGFRTQTSSYHTGSRNGNLMGRHGNNYGEISHPSIYDILRPSTPRQGFRTFSYRTKTIYDMYGTREYTVSQEEYKTFGSSSLCSDRTQPLASPTLGHFTANSLHLPSYSERKSVFLPRSHQQSPRRTPLSSIIWNRSYTPGDVQYQEEFLRAESPMEVDPVHQDAYPNQPQGNGRNKFYHFSNVYQSVRPHAPWDRTTSPESFENSENIPFHQHENKFSQSYYYNTTGPRRLQKFGESPFWNKKEEFPSLSDFHHRNKEFNSSNRDFEMISTDVNEVSAIYNDSIPVPSQPWRANFSRNKESIHREFNFQTCVSEDMEVLSQDNGTQVDLKEKYEHLPTPSMDTMGNKFWNAPDIYSRSQVKLDMLGSQQKWPPMEAKSNSKTNLPETTQNLASSVQIPHRTETFQHSDCQNAPTMSWDPKRDAPDESASFPLRSQKEFIETSGDSITVNRNQSNTWITELNPEKDLIKSMSEKMGHLNKVDETSQVDKTVPIVSQSTIMETTPDYQLSLSRDSTTLSSNKFVFNAPVSIVSKKPTGVFGKRDISKIYISNKDKANALKKEKDSTMERKPDSGTSFPFSQENRTTLSFPKQNQGFQQESAKNNVGISNIKNEDWKLETASNRNPQYKGDSFVLDANNMQGGQLKNALVPPTNCSRFAENHHGPSDHSPDLLPDDGQSLPSSFPVDSTSLASLVTPSGTSLNFTSNVLAKEEMFSKKSLLGKDASKRESEEKACSGNTDQNDQLTVSTSENQASGDIQVLDIHKLKDVAKCHPDHSFTLGREKGKIRRSLSYIEKLSKSGNFLRQASNDSNDIVPNQGNSQSLETLDIYCTFPRKLTSFLIDDNKKLENKIMSTSFRKGPPPFQIKNIKDPLEKCFSNKNNSNSSEPNRRCPEVNVNSSSLRSTPEEITTNIRNIAPASFRKGPPPFEIKGTRPFGTCSSDGVDRRDKYGLDTEPFILTPRPEELISTSQENSPSIKKHSLQLTKGHPHEESFQVHSENHSKMASSQKDNLANTFFLPDEKHLSSSPDMSEKQNGKPLHKYKTTSTVTISGDEDNVKRLEVVSIYYTLPRKHNKKLCDFLKSDTQSISLSPESTTVEDATFPISFSKKQLNSSAQSLPETPVSPYAKASVSRCQWRKHSFSQDTETGALFQSPHSPYPGAEKPSAETLQEMVGGISLCGECNPTKTPSAKTISGDLQSKSVDTFSFIPGHQQGQEKWQNHSRYASVSPTELHNKLVRERKLENPKQSIKVYERESPSVIQTHLRDASNSPCRREILEKCGPCNIDAMSIGSRNYSGEEVNDKMNLVSGAKSFYDNVRESQPDSADGKLKTDDQKIIEKTCSALQSKDFSLSSNSVKLQPEERNHKGQPDLERSLREPKEVPQEKDTDKRSNTEKDRLAEVEDAPNTKANEKMQGLPYDQYSPPKVIDEIKCNLDCTKEKTNLEKRKNRPSVKQKLAAMSKVSRKFSTKDMSSRRHIATIFPQEEVNSSTNSLPQNTPEMAPSSAKSTLGIPESTHESKKSGTSGSESIALPTAEVSKTENPLQPPLDSIQKPITYVSEQKTTTSSSKPQKNKLENVTESPSSSTNFENAILMERGKCPQRLKTEHETPTQPMISSPGTKDFSDDLKRLSLQFPSKAACKAPDKRILPPSTQPQQKNISLQEWEPDSNLYRSKSLKNINEPSNQPQISQTQKMRERHFSACTFSDNAPDRGKLGDEFPVRSGHGRRFRSFSELSACDEKDTWTLGSDRARASGPRATSSISRPIDYGIFGKEQQLAFLENVKRSLTEGRLWRPNFLKNPGFLTDDANHPADKPESLTSGKMSKDGLSPREVLNIYQDAPVVGHSGSDTDTTTDDEYYLDEADKESEL